MTPPPADDRRLVPAFLATTGRARPSRNTLDRLTVLHGATDPATVTGLRPEETRLLELLRGGALSLAEAAAHLRLPVSVVKVLVADLVDGGRLMARAPIPDAELPERQILEKVLNGLRTLKSF
ncbi:DUF742 domain-containing protein [Streptomyces albus]|uniref:DUF742 domain-containing protein n=1 Tax=Streptomyces albus TaxID=1888 RepID=A0A6C1C3N0_9ACTN|nr:MULTISPECIES: DUF742 domain-containing protein [Streptomyces]KPC67812.1 hypothetical protein ADL27_58035 [Streptomyces sp. NRRL F-6602]EPD90663.1 hypothetical protein HMPREF1486_05695 [Streptomyces sp. HPH0547]MDI6410579.1 DUF742 domain-containing protein [Streptomyces albus]QID36820.1 DUF742 domain-containing protein [Streptomyces albus]TGG84672.1 DUF742 domain-containing protein [Streptomyces albus]